MDEKKKECSIFELGILIGRLSQLGADNGIVKKGKGIGILDIIETTGVVLEDSQFETDCISEIKKDLEELRKIFEKYEINTSLTDEDSDKIIKMSSNWRRKISDELDKRSVKNTKKTRTLKGKKKEKHD